MSAYSRSGSSECCQTSFAFLYLCLWFHSAVNPLLGALGLLVIVHVAATQCKCWLRLCCSASSRSLFVVLARFSVWDLASPACTSLALCSVTCHPLQPSKSSINLLPHAPPSPVGHRDHVPWADPRDICAGIWCAQSQITAPHFSLHVYMLRLSVPWVTNVLFWFFIWLPQKILERTS